RPPAAHAPSLLVVDAGEIDSQSALEPLAPIKCPRMVLYPFGQTAPVALDDGQPIASTTKPVRTTSFLHAIISLFQSVTAGPAAAARIVERPIGEQIPLEVLLAEDNAVNQKVALRFLERRGY